MKNNILSIIKVIIRTYYLKWLSKDIIVNGWQNIPLSTEINILENGTIHLGKNTTCQKRVALSAVGGTLVIGNDVAFNRNCIVVCREKINIGNSCQFGPNVCFYDHDHVFSRKGIECNEYKTAPIVIEESCWIGANVTILKGAKIGKGSIIGAGCVITGVIPEYSIVKADRKVSIKNIK